MSETSSADGERRHSIAFEPDLIKDPVKLAEAEAANGLRQFDLGKNVAQGAIDRQASGGPQFRLRPSAYMLRADSDQPVSYPQALK